jgi:hypothetical protein
MTLNQRIDDLEEKYRKDEERAIGLLNQRAISKRFFGYILASLSIDTETEKANAYFDGGYHKDGLKVYECSKRAFCNLASITRAYSEPQEHHDSPATMNEDYQPLINFLIGKFNRILGNIFEARPKEIK